ncbi:hypothetical protein Tco_1114538 [Tanacetum coccineum]|uniref:Uncharacterized protein n=1 Tax=Tanacetum coccineum TaxID=301880 RepID=A0ABQ5IVD3_9ASTR
MSNTNTNLQTQTSNALQNAIIEAGGKDRPPMLASGNYNPPYKFKWTEKTIPVAEGIDNDIYSTVDACPNACEMWKAIERLKQVLTSTTTRMAKNEVNEIRAERLARTANTLALVAQQQPVYHPQNHPTHYTHNSSTKSQQAATRNKGQVIVNSSTPTYDQEPTMVAEDDEMSKDKEIDILMALISLSFKKIYKPTNNNLRTSSNTSRANQDNTPRINKGTGYDNKRVVNVVRARENVEVTLDVADNSGPILDAEALQKVQNNDDNYNVFAIENEHLEQPESVNDTYLEEQGDTNITIDSLDMCYNGETVDQDDDDDDLAKEFDLLASLIEKLQCEIDDSKNRNKFLETSNKALVDKLKGEIEDFKIKNKSLESSNNHFKEANNELSKSNHSVDVQKPFRSSKLNVNEFCQTCVKPEFLKKAQRANPRLYDIGCYNDNLALMLAPESDETIRLAQESRSKLSDLIRPFDYKNLNNLYDLFVPQREKSPEQRYFSERSKMSHTPVKNENSKESFNKQTTLLEKRMDESIPEYYYDDHMNAILGVYTKMDEVTNLQCDYLEALEKCERLENELSKTRTMSKSFEALWKHAINLELALQQYLKAQLQDKGIAISELKKLIENMKGKSVETKFEKSSVIRQPNAFKSQQQSILCKPTTFSNSLAKTDFSKSKSVTTNNVSNDFLKPVTVQILPQNVMTILKNTNVIDPGMYKVHTKPNQTRTPQLPQDIKKTNKRVFFSTRVIPTTSVSRPQLKSNQLENRVMPNSSQGKKQEVEYYHRNFKFSNNKTSITACNDSLNAKTSNVNFVCVTCGKCMLNDNHDMCVLHFINGVNSRTKIPVVVPISTREHKQTVNQSVATPLKRTGASEFTNQKPRHTTRKLYEHVSKICSWWYPKFTPSGYKWKPKSLIGNVNTNVSMPLGNASRTANNLEPMTPRCSTVSNTPLSSNSFVARRDNPIHRRLWVLKAHDGKSQASN